MNRVMMLIALLFAFGGAPALGASFDCGKVRMPDEKAICTNPALSSLDSEMAGLFFAYDKVPMYMGGNGARHDAAEEFLAKRSACGGDVACLTTAYDERIKDLRSNIEASMQVMFDLQNGEPAEIGLPQGVETIIADYADQCTQLGGTLSSAASRPLTMSADFDGDTRDDYVLNPQNLECSAAATAYCGNGGCDIRIAVSGNSYADPVSVMGGEPGLTQSDAGTAVLVWVSDSNCPALNDGEACWARYAWTDGEPAVTYAGHPIPSEQD